MCVQEYFGEMHLPWRWFEIQDAIKRFQKDELPEFYNIQLERPRDDHAGYDVLFIDAASKVTTSVYFAGYWGGKTKMASSIFSLTCYRGYVCT